MLQVFHKGEGDDISFVRENVTFKVRQIKKTIARAPCGLCK